MRPIFVLVLLGAVSCSKDSTSPVTYHDVYTIGDSFSPFSETIPAGDGIRWIFAPGSDGDGHNVRFSPTVAGAPAQVPVRKTGEETRVFTAKGDFHYVCDVHPGMIGQIIVQ
jgi:plastocyanin